MAEYILPNTSATRRRDIRQAARFPKTSVVARYSGARKGIVNYLGDSTRSVNHLVRAINLMESKAQRAGATPWTKEDCSFSIEAISAFQRSYNSLGITRLNFQTMTGSQPMITEWASKVSVRLDLLARRPQKEGPDKIGGVILSFSKGESSGRKRIDQLKNLAGLILVQCNQHYSGIGIIDPKLCMAIDVFQGRVHQPPGTFSNGIKQAQQCGLEIANLWNTIPAPRDYDGPPV